MDKYSSLHVHVYKISSLIMYPHVIFLYQVYLNAWSCLLHQLRVRKWTILKIEIKIRFTILLDLQFCTFNSVFFLNFYLASNNREVSTNIFASTVALADLALSTHYSPIINISKFVRNHIKFKFEITNGFTMAQLIFAKYVNKNRII